MKDHPHIDNTGLHFKHLEISFDEFMDRMEKIEYPLCIKGDIEREFNCGRDKGNEIKHFFWHNDNARKELLERFYKNHGEATPTKVIEYYLRGVKTGAIEDWININHKKDGSKHRTTLVSFIKTDKDALAKYAEATGATYGNGNKKAQYARNELEKMVSGEFNLKDLDETRCSKESMIKWALMFVDKYDVIIRPRSKKC